MSVSFGAFQAALNGMRTHQNAFDRAAHKVVKATLSTPTNPVDLAEFSGGGVDPTQVADGAGMMTDGMVEMMTAQHAYTASLRALESAHEMLRDVMKQLA